VTLAVECLSFQVLSEIIACKRLPRFRFVNKSTSRATKLLLVMLIAVLVYSVATVGREGVISTVNLLGLLFVVTCLFVLLAVEIINSAIRLN
jgi:hypothetical protein